MHGNVAESNDVSSLNFRTTFPEFWWQSGGCLTNDDQLLKYGALTQLVIEKVFALNPLDKALNGICGFYNVGQVQLFTPHKAPPHWTGPPPELWVSAPLAAPNPRAGPVAQKTPAACDS